MYKYTWKSQTAEDFTKFINGEYKSAAVESFDIPTITAPEKHETVKKKIPKKFS
jgi:hypothetical protein